MSDPYRSDFRVSDFEFQFSSFDFRVSSFDFRPRCFLVSIFQFLFSRFQLLPQFHSTPHNGQVLGRLRGSDWLVLGSKTSSFLAPKIAKSFVCNKSLSSFPLFNIFFLFFEAFAPLSLRSANRFPGVQASPLM